MARYHDVIMARYHDVMTPRFHDNQFSAAMCHAAVSFITECRVCRALSHGLYCYVFIIRLYSALSLQCSVANTRMQRAEL